MLLSDREFFGQHSLAATGYVRRRRKAASRTVDPNKMRPGDFVVHRNHGIGRFLKLEKLAIGGEARDYLVVQYADGLLRVAADQLGSLGRYRASSDSPPELNRMGGTAWTKAKERARKAVAKVAMDLVKLYAERHQAPGFAFPPDGPWQSELEDSFPYDPTPDQLRAIVEVKRDMERSQPMDRLVCGDVGFGKTEVAIRAIFKAVTAGKQCALLAPTTVLAQQHWRTLSERFAPYPLKVALLNRFRTAAERRTILEGLEERHHRRGGGHPPIAGQRHLLPPAGVAGGGRGAALRCQSEGEDQGAAQGRGRADPLGHSDSPHPLHEPLRACGR